MERLISPNGHVVCASDHDAPRLKANGYKVEPKKAKPKKEKAKKTEG